MGLRALCKLPDGRDWQWEKLGLVLVGSAMLIKSLIQLFADGWSCAPFLLVVWLVATQPWGLWTLCGVNSNLQKDLRQEAFSRTAASAIIPAEATADPHLHRRPSGTSRWNLAQSSLGSWLPSPGSWGAQDCVCAFWVDSLSFPQSYNQIPLAFKVRFPGNSQFLSQLTRLGRLTQG